jgi:hypothetical protein
MFKRMLQKLFKKEIATMARELADGQALEAYMAENFDFSRLSKGELCFRGKHIAHYMADCFYEVLEENNAENYVTMNFVAMKKNCDNIIVTIQRVAPGTMTPHAKAEHFKAKYEELKQKYECDRPE